MLLVVLFALFLVCGAERDAVQSGYELRRSKYFDFPGVLRFCKSPQVAALTFDDGPEHGITPQLLDLLQQRNVKATFFVLGCKCEGGAEILRRILHEGHTIGCHSWDHKDLVQVGNGAYWECTGQGRSEEECNRHAVEVISEDLRQNANVIQQITGQYPLYFRPPYGYQAKSLFFLFSTPINTHLLGSCVGVLMSGSGMQPRRSA